MNSRAVSTILAFILLSTAAFAQQGFHRMGGDATNGSVSISVRDTSGAGVADARIEIRESQMGQTVKAGYTNIAGNAEFGGLSHGLYEVVVTKGLVEVIERVDVRSMGSTVAVRLGSAAGDPQAGDRNKVSVAQYKIPGKARKEYGKAREKLNERKLEEAEKHLAKALEIHPKYAEALTMRAIIKMDRNELEAAAKDLDAALEYDPSDATTYFVYGANLNLRSQFDLAIQSLERGVTLNPMGWQGYFELGKAQVGKQNYKQALKYLDRAQAVVNFEYPPIHLVKAHALLALKDYPEAMGELQVFLDKSPQGPSSDDARKTLEQVKAFASK